VRRSAGSSRHPTVTRRPRSRRVGRPSAPHVPRTRPQASITAKLLSSGTTSKTRFSRRKSR
jgi:hypothetical protein